MLRLCRPHCLVHAAAATLIAALVCSCLPAETVSGEGKGGTTRQCRRGRHVRHRQEARDRAGRPAAWPGRPVLPVPRARLPVRAGEAEAEARPERQATAEPAVTPARAEASDAGEPAAAPARPRAAEARRPAVGGGGARGGAGGRGGSGGAGRGGTAGPRAPAERRRCSRSSSATSTRAARSARTSTCTGTSSRPRTRASGAPSKGRATQMNWNSPRRHVQVRQGPQHHLQAAQLRLGQPATGLDRRPVADRAARRGGRMDPPLLRALSRHRAHRRRERAAAAHDAVLHGGIGGAGTSGYDWIANAFKWAREACPNAILILNDYNNIEYASDNSHTIDIVNAIKSAGAPIDAVGCQAHDARTSPPARCKTYIDKIASADRPAGLHHRVRHQHRRRQQAARRHAETSSRCSGTTPTSRASRSGATSSASTWVTNTRPHAQQRHHAAGDDLADGLPRPLKRGTRKVESG